MTVRSPWLPCLLALVGTTALAQSGVVAVGLSPVPIWPQSGVVPAEFRDWYVFLDPEAGELVLSYPENLGSPDFERSPGIPLIKRINVGDRVAASVSVAVDAHGPHFEYRYRVSNDAGADPIRHLEMEVPAFVEEAYDVSAPKNWLSAVDQRAAGGFPSPIGPPLSGRLRWAIDDENQIGQPQISAIMAGTARQGFAVTTSLRPGLTTMYAVGRDAPVLGNEIPEIVRAQAQPMLRYIRQPVFTIGPRYPKDAPMIEVVAGYHAGIAMLVRYGILAATSSSVVETLGQLKGFLEYAEAVYSGAGDVRSSDMAGPKLVFREGPKGGIESEILESMKLSLRK